MRRSHDDREEVEVHLEIMPALRAVGESIAWYGLFVFLGIALHRAFVHLID